MLSVSRTIQVSAKRRVLLFAFSLFAAALRLFRARGRVASKAIVIEPFGMGDAISILPMVEQLQGPRAAAGAKCRL